MAMGDHHRLVVSCSCSGVGPGPPGGPGTVQTLLLDTQSGALTPLAGPEICGGNVQWATASPSRGTIYVLENSGDGGTVVESGTHEELLSRLEGYAAGRDFAAHLAGLAHEQRVAQGLLQALDLQDGLFHHRWL